eukprot:1925943-Rhodomonas_salina.2
MISTSGSLTTACSVSTCAGSSSAEVRTTTSHARGPERRGAMRTSADMPRSEGVESPGHGPCQDQPARWVV